MRKILIFGNSSSGKSTLAKAISRVEGLAHLDLDTLAWKSDVPPERQDLSLSHEQLQTFITQNPGWVIEGCYADLMDLLATEANEVIFMNLSVDDCKSNALNRPWESHKYKNKEEQDDNLSMLLEWITQYTQRQDCTSLNAHQEFFDSFTGKKTMITKNHGAFNDSL